MYYIILLYSVSLYNYTTQYYKKCYAILYYNRCTVFAEHFGLKIEQVFMLDLNPSSEVHSSSLYCEEQSKSRLPLNWSGLSESWR